VDAPLILVIALAFTLGGTGVGFVLGRPRAPHPSVLAQTGQIIEALQEHMAQLTAEVGQARTEAHTARTETEVLRHDYAALVAQGTRERADLSRQIYEARADLATAQASLDALRRAVQAEPPDIMSRILGRMPPTEPRTAHGTGPLVPPPGLPGSTPGARAVLSTKAQAALLGLLLQAEWLFGEAKGRTLLLRSCPPDFVSSLDRAGDARRDLSTILDRAATWMVPPGDPPLLRVVLDDAALLLGDSQVGGALHAWRATWDL
jgi:hypothetical protein